MSPRIFAVNAADWEKINAEAQGREDAEIGCNRLPAIGKPAARLRSA